MTRISVKSYFSIITIDFLNFFYALRIFIETRLIPSCVSWSLVHLMLPTIHHQCSQQLHIDCLNSAQLPVELTYFSRGRKAQFDVRLIKYDLLCFIYDTKSSHPIQILSEGKKIPNLEFILWERRDKLLLQCIIFYLFAKVLSLTSYSKTGPRTIQTPCLLVSWD